MTISINKIYTILVVTFPILSLYGIGLSTVTLADFFLLLVYPLLINYTFPKCRGFSYPLILFVVYIFLQYAILSYGDSIALLKTVRYTFYILTLAIFNKTFFSYSYGVNVLGKISFFATTFLLIQYILFHFSGYYLPGYLSFLPVLRSELIEFSNYIGLDGGDVRVRSIFGEPAHFAQYVLVYVTLLLFTKNIPYKKIAFFLLGIFVAASSTGILMILVLGLIYIKEHFTTRIKKTTLLWIFIVILLSCLIVPHLEFYDRAVNKLFSVRAADARFGAFSILIGNIQFSLTDIFFGHSLKPLTIYLPGYLALFYYFGLVGLLIYILSNICIYTHSSKKQKILLLVFAILNLGTEVALGPFIVLYFSFILYRDTSNC